MATAIEWTDETWNPVTGCSKISEGCKNCYAERMARRLAGRYGYPEAPHHFDVTFHVGRFYRPMNWRKPRRVFVCSMGDLFHKGVGWTHTRMVFAVMRCVDRHIYQVLTKRAFSMRDFVETNFPELDKEAPNIWGLVTAENQAMADKRIPDLLATPFAVRGVSVEPMLGPVDLSAYLSNSRMYSAKGKPWWTHHGQPLDLHWVIVGCESGPGRRPCKPEWVLDLVEQCQVAGVPVFVKQLDLDGRVSRDPAEWPEDLRVREYPDG